MEVEQPHPSPSKPQPSSFYQQPDDSKYSYTALIFNDPSKTVNTKCMAFQAKQISLHRDNSAYILDSIKIQSLSKTISNKDIRNSLTLFENTKLNTTLENKKAKVMQRPASAQTKTVEKPHTHHYSNLTHKQKTGRKSRQMSLLGKKCFSEINIQIKEKVGDCKSTQEKSEEGKNIEKYQYNSKSRLKSGKSVNKNSCGQGGQRDSKQSIKYDQFIDFQSLYKNLLINSKIITKVKIPNKSHTPYFYKKHKGSFYKHERTKQNNKNIGDAFMVNCQKNIVQGNKAKSKIFVTSGSFINFHKGMKISRGSDILASFKEGKEKISKLVSMNKTEISQPQLYIENIPIIPKQGKQHESLTSTNISKYEEKIAERGKQSAKYSLKSEYSCINSCLLECKGTKYC